MRSIVLPLYHGGHVLSKMQCRQLYLQEGKGSQKGKKKQNKNKNKNKNKKTWPKMVLVPKVKI